LTPLIYIRFHRFLIWDFTDYFSDISPIYTKFLLSTQSFYNRRNSLQIGEITFKKSVKSPLKNR